MTYRALLCHLLEMSSKELNQEISCYDLADDHFKDVVEIVEELHPLNLKPHTICIN